MKFHSAQLALPSIVVFRCVAFAGWYFFLLWIFSPPINMIHTQCQRKAEFNRIKAESQQMCDRLLIGLHVCYKDITAVLLRQSWLVADLSVKNVQIAGSLAFCSPVCVWVMCGSCVIMYRAIPDTVTLSTVRSLAFVFINGWLHLAVLNVQGYDGERTEHLPLPRIYTDYAFLRFFNKNVEMWDVWVTSDVFSDDSLTSSYLVQMMRNE